MAQCETCGHLGAAQNMWVLDGKILCPACRDRALVQPYLTAGEKMRLAVARYRAVRRPSIASAASGATHSGDTGVGVESTSMSAVRVLP